MQFWGALFLTPLLGGDTPGPLLSHLTWARAATVDLGIHFSTMENQKNNIFYIFISFVCKL